MDNIYSPMDLDISPIPTVPTSPTCDHKVKFFNQLPPEIKLVFLGIYFPPWSMTVTRHSCSGGTQYRISGLPNTLSLLRTNIFFYNEGRRALIRSFDGKLNLGRRAHTHLAKLILNHDLHWLLRFVRMLTVTVESNCVPRAPYQAFPNLQTLHFVFPITRPLQGQKLRSEIKKGVMDNQILKEAVTFAIRLRIPQTPIDLLKMKGVQILGIYECLTAWQDNVRLIVDLSYPVRIVERK